MTTEYRTTSSPTSWMHPPTPLVPPGEGWRLVCMAASDANIYWSWQRDSRPTEPCPGVGPTVCGALAVRAGRCTGCGRPRP